MIDDGTVAAVVARLRVDKWTVEVVQAFRAAGIDPVLLKGPAVARWLYPDEPAARGYVDADLLVAPEHTPAACLLLTELGFVVDDHPWLELDEIHSRSFRRASDGANVDLHRTLHGCYSVAPDQLWAAVAHDQQPIVVANLPMRTLGPTLRVLHVALHLEPGDPPGCQAWRDLERAISVTAVPRWQAAHRLARQLGVEPELAIRLRRLPAGGAIADALGMSTEPTRRYRLLAATIAGELPSGTLSIAQAAAVPSGAQRRRYILRKLFPTADQLRHQSALARRGSTGLALAALGRLAHIAVRAPRALLASRGR